MSRFNLSDHCFVICAYKESPFLEECIASLEDQSVKTNILIETSTPCDYITEIAKKHNLQIVVNSGKNGCAQDWNYGFNHVNNKLVTIAHQDDVYYPTYAENIINYANKANDPVLIYTDYSEIRNGKTVNCNILLLIKRILNIPMLYSKNWNKQSKKRDILKFGNAISCPTVTLVKDKVGTSPYDEEYKCSVDYKTWIKLSNVPGDFVYIPKILMSHRIYEESHTSIYLKENIRQKEDREIISSFWPGLFGKIINYFYSFSQKNNKL